MRTSLVRLHQEFGKLYKGVRRVAYYKLSPFEQRAFAGYSELPMYFIRSIASTAKNWAPPLVVFYLVYNWANEENYKIHRKNPADYQLTEK